MSLEEHQKDVDKRASEIRSYLRLIETNTSSGSLAVRQDLLAARGLATIYIYGLVEFGLCGALQIVLSTIRQEGHFVEELDYHVRSFALDRKLQTLENQNGRRNWLKRKELFEESTQMAVAEIDDAVLPLARGNIKASHFDDVEKVFELNKQLIPRRDIRGHLDEIANARMEVAHGRKSATETGRAFSLEKLQNRKDSTIEIIYNVNYVFTEYLKDRRYLKRMRGG